MQKKGKNAHRREEQRCDNDNTGEAPTAAMGADWTQRHKWGAATAQSGRSNDVDAAAATSSSKQQQQSSSKARANN
jgi:hypothetical protein